jgi:hypothetical protein
VAISDKKLPSGRSFMIQMFEMCTTRGVRFGIGYHGLGDSDERETARAEEWPRRPMEILAKHHRQERAHKSFMDLDT